MTTVTVDTTPPAAPTGLKSTVTRAREGYGQVRVTWNANTEPDLAGYRVSRDGADLVSDLVPPPAWDDGERIEGRYVYSVVAVDKAGNVSPPTKLPVLVDLTPPTVAFLAPASGASVTGSVEVRGTAYSTDDFAEYRLSSARARRRRPGLSCGYLLAFDQFYILTKGGPDNSTVTLVQLIYREAFTLQNLGAAAAASIVVLLALLVLNGLQFRGLGRSVGD